MAKLPYPDTGKYDEKHEAEIRDMITLLANYAEKGETFDPKGDYLCGSCTMRLKNKACTHVEGPKSMSHGGCRIYVIGKPMDEDMALPKKMSEMEVLYTEHPKPGFGCKRCEYGAEAKAKDKAERPTWCGFWGLHVIPNACCAQNSTPEDKVAPHKSQRVIEAAKETLGG